MKYIIRYLVKKFGISALVTAISVFYFQAVIAFYAFAIIGKSDEPNTNSYNQGK